MFLNAFKPIFFLLIITPIIFTNCMRTNSKDQISTELKNELMTREAESPIYVNPNRGIQTASKLKILVVQCSNGYEYSMHSYDFNPTIENHLKKFDDFQVLPFSLKKLQGVNYQGVFDKKYCQPIIDRINADILILTRFDKEYIPTDPMMKWGYEIKIVDAKTMKQINSIGAHELGSYVELEKHLKGNVQKLKNDILGIIDSE